MSWHNAANRPEQAENKKLINFQIEVINQEAQHNNHQHHSSKKF